jgi:hypothetical protein
LFFWEHHVHQTYRAPPARRHRLVLQSICLRLWQPETRGEADDIHRRATTAAARIGWEDLVLP